MKQKIEFEFETLQKVNLRDVFYTVERLDSFNFYGKCPICDNDKKIFVRGEEFTCPRCHGYGSGSSVLSVERFIVKRWRVKNFIIGFKMYEWKAPAQNDVIIELGRTKYGESFTETKNVTICDHLGRCYFEGSKGEKLLSDYKEAVRLADEKNCESAAKVAEYNEIHGTDFEFKIPAYDVKSK